MIMDFNHGYASAVATVAYTGGKDKKSSKKISKSS